VTELETIFVELLEEGTQVWRPVMAVRLQESVYQIPRDAIIPADEVWAFAPGDVVVCETRQFEGSPDGPVAIRRV
jgi:hypothetical protein